MKSSATMTTQEEKETPSDAQAEYKIIRRLGRLECFQSTLHSLGHYRSTAVTCRYSVPPALDRQPQLARAFEHAVAQVVLDVPALRVGLAGQHARRPAWVAVDAVDLEQHVEWRALEPGEDPGQLYPGLAAQRLDTPFAELETVPGWRVLVLRGGAAGSRSMDVVFEFNHANMDGAGAKIIQNMLLRNLNISSSSSSPAPLPLENHILTIPPTARPLPPPLEKLCRFTLTPGWVLSMLWRELNPLAALASWLWPSASPSPLAHWAPVKPRPYATQHRVFLLPADRLRAVLAACRARGATLTGLVHAAAACSLAARLPATARAFIGETQMDMRRWIVPPGVGGSEEGDEMVGDFVSVMEHEFGVAVVDRMRALSPLLPLPLPPPPPPPALEDLLWSEATRVRGEIRARLDRGLENDVVGLARFVVDWRARERSRKERRASYAVSNLGVLGGDGDGSEPTGTEGGGDCGDHHEGARWGIERAMFSFGPEVAGAALRIGLVSVKGGQLCVSCCWQDSVVDAEVGEALIADLECWLQYLGRP